MKDETASGVKYCDLSCPHADFPKQDVDGSGSCMTFAAIWCQELHAHVTKNAPCAATRGKAGATS
jgi:hypothetical protein